MSTIAVRAAAAYRTTHVRSRSPVELVVILYDGLVSCLTEARDALARGDLHTKRTALSLALGIVGELHRGLDREKGGQVAEQLEALYTYISGRLLEANVKGQVDGLEEALQLVRPLREAWSQIAVDAPAAKVSA